MNLRSLTMIVIGVLIFLTFGCEDKTTDYYGPVFDEQETKVNKPKPEPKKAKIVEKKKPSPKITQPEINKEDKFTKMLLDEGVQWLDVIKVFQDTTREIYSYYFENKGSYGDLNSGQDLTEVYKIIKGQSAPRMKVVEAKNFTLSKIIPTENRLIFTAIRPQDETHSADMMKFDVCPKWAKMKMTSYIEQIFVLAQSEENIKFDKYKWIEAENLLLGMQTAFMFFLYENEFTEFDNIKYPMDLSALANLLEYDVEVFKKLKFFKETEFKLRNFNYLSREFLLTAESSGKFPAPRSGTIRAMSRAGWYDFKKKEVEPEIKAENKQPKVVKKNDENKKTDDTEEKEPEVSNPQRLPSIKGKKVSLNIDYNVEVRFKNNISQSKLEAMVPSRPYDFDDRFEKVLEEMGATVVNSGADAEINITIDIDVDAQTWMEEIFNVKLYGKIKVESSFGDKQNSFDGSFNQRDNEMERCFDNLWNESVDKFREITRYAFLSK